jgi:hypothetical protein
MKELNDAEVEAVSGGDALMTVAGIVVGVAAGALVVGTGGAILASGIIGGAIWGGGSALLHYLR